MFHFEFIMQSGLLYLLPNRNFLNVIVVHHHSIQPSGSSLVLQLLQHCVSIIGEFTYWSHALIPPNPEVHL